MKTMDDEEELFVFLYFCVFNGVSLTGSKDLKEKRKEQNYRKSMRHFRSPLKGSEFKKKDVTLLKVFSKRIFCC